jgi:PAS domain S-box-containing protein
VTLKAKLLLLVFGASVLATGIIGGILYRWLWGYQLDSLRRAISSHLLDSQHSLETFIEEVESDLGAIVENPLVKTRDDHGFTSFLDADESTFQYSYTDTEREIIGVFNSYRLSHRYVNSVYMGRENGSFVRSHERARPTAYDPRERPWYVLAKADPDRVVETDAYSSVTTPDVNIGVVKSLLDEDGTFYGAVGIDITLANLTGYIVNASFLPVGQVLLIDRTGTILASQQSELRTTSIYDHAEDLTADRLSSADGMIEVTFAHQRNLLFYEMPTRQEWRVLALVPMREIRAQVGSPVLTTVVGLAFGWLLIGLLLLGGLELIVIRPLEKLTDVSGYIAETSNLDQQVEVRSSDEIGMLGRTYNKMIDSLRQSHDTVEKNEAALLKYRDHLEELVQRRTHELEVVNEHLQTEIAERTAAQQSLADRETEYHDLIESANSIIMRWRPDGSITFFNRFALTFFGYTEEEVLGRNLVGTILSDKDSTGRNLSDLITDIVEHPEAHVRNVNENTRRNGERVWIAWANKPIRSLDGGISEILSIGVDVSQQVRTEAQLRNALRELAIEKEKAETADRLKSAFLATMSHELRTPLNSIIGFTGILLQGMVGPLNDEQTKQLGMVRNSAQHLLSLISDILDISKIEAGQLAMSLGEVNVRTSVEKVAQIVRPLADKKGIEFRLSVAPEVDKVRTDQRRMEQILLNILSNAVKFTEKGSVEMSCTTSAGEVVFRVEDTGIGIDPSDIDGLFKPFQQIDTGLSRKYEGTGLGLSICKKLVELLGGRIWVESLAGRGSVFGFTLPPNGDGT